MAKAKQLPINMISSRLLDSEKPAVIVSRAGIHLWKVKHAAAHLLLEGLPFGPFFVGEHLIGGANFLADSKLLGPVLRHGQQVGLRHIVRKVANYWYSWQHIHHFYFFVIGHSLRLLV